MQNVVGHLCPGKKFNSIKFLMFIFLMMTSHFVSAHGVQVGYCVTTGGNIRVFIEHWHGDYNSINDVANAIVTINVTDSSTGITTTNMTLPTGIVNNTAIGSLPDCKGPLTVVSACGGANNYNDWAYWDFTPPSCFENLTIEVASVSGSDAVIFQEQCNSLYPVSFVDSFIDCVPPTIECPGNVTEEVNATGCAANIVGLNPTILSDDCSDIADIGLDYTITGATNRTGTGDADGLFNKGTSIVTYTATDEVGSTSTCSFTVLVEDNTDPTLVCPSTLTLNCGDANNVALTTAWLSTVSASDFCGVSSLTNNFTVLNTTKGSQDVIFSATDGCGNMSTCSSTIEIVDVDPPVITCPLEITIECGAAGNNALIQSWIETASATDECDSDVLITNDFVDSFSGGCGVTGTRTVTFTADDGCGNTSTCQVDIVMEDTTPPVFIIEPQDGEGDCININGANGARNLWRNTFGGGLATDDCDVNVTWTSTLLSTVPGCGYTKTEEWMFRVTDDCGNTNTAVAFFDAVDNTPPVINLPADRVFNCHEVNNPGQIANALALGTATDACSLNADVTLSYVLFSSVSACGATGTDTYLYTATDLCGNESTALFNITLTDTNLPSTTNCPSSITIECGDSNNPSIISVWLAEALSTMGSDVCHGTTTTHDFDGVIPEDCAINIPVIFTVTDECGNQRSCTRNIRKRDRIAPAIVSCSADITVNVDVDNCGSNVVYSTPAFKDQCDQDLTITLEEGLASGSTFPLGTTTVEYMAEDDCGRSISCSFDVTVVDSQLPSIQCPSTAVAICADIGGCTWTADNTIGPITSDNCTGMTVTYTVTGVTSAAGSDNAQGVVFNLGISTVCYEIEDGEGNTADCCFDVVVEDCESPAITCPADITVECDGSGNFGDLTSWLGGVTATDNCTIVSTTNEAFNNISECGGSESIVYKFIATDPAGNETYCYATFTIEDTARPVITPPASAGSSNCDNADADLLGWLNDNGGAVATDLCGAVTWSNNYVGGSTIGCSGVTSVTVTFTARDECGNIAETTATFDVDDTEPPMIDCPSDITLECGNPTNDAVIDLWLLSVTATDNCTTPTITNTYPNIFSPNCGDAGSYNITFTAQDVCGNMGTCTANIVIEDNTNPVLLVQPKDLYVECDGAGNVGDIAVWHMTNGGGLAVDDCDNILDWTITQVGIDPICGGATVLEYEFKVVDDCSNEVDLYAFVYIEDTTGPILTTPADASASCTPDPASAKATWLGSATANDACGGSVSITTTLFNSISGCGSEEDETYLFIATDDCGNETTGLATFAINDAAPPILTCPTDLTIQCGTSANPTIIAAWLDSVEGTDACSNIAYANNYTGLFPANCGGSITVTFTGEDECGNIDQCTASITMIDSAIPDFVNFPDDITINVDVDACGSNPIFSTPAAVDNCDVTVEQTDGPASGAAFPLGDTTVEFTATDACGNSITDSFVITVEDSDVPLILCASIPMTICTDEGTCTWASTDIGPSLGVENCPMYTIGYTVTGVTSAMGTDDASGTLFLLGESEVCYTITDNAGNTSSCCFTVIVQDCENPVITCPADQTVECDGAGNILAVNAWANAMVTDNCDPAVTVVSELFSENSTCGGTVTQVYQFTATDNNGNTSFCYANFIIEDTVGPTIDMPASNLLVECNGTESDDLLGWLNMNGGAAASDICSGLIWSNNFTGSLSDLCGQTGEVEVVFSATDDCGNSTTTMATFTIEDTVVPNVDCPTGIVVQCDETINDAVISNWLNSASASDDCGVVTITNNYSASFMGACGDSGIYTVTFTATDDCGNTSTCNSTIEIIDTVLPTFDILPSDLTVECGASSLGLYSTWLLSFGDGVASDNCGTVTWSVSAQTPVVVCGNSESITHIFTITDACGNVSTALADFITEDTTSPTVALPANLTVECDGAGNTAAKTAWLDSVNGIDLCGSTTTTYRLSNTISECGDSMTEVYLFTATDECGNVGTGEASFVINDVTIPMITCPADLVLECGDDENSLLITTWLNSVTGTDICGSVSFTNNYTGILPSDCAGSVGVTFTATDECGNINTCIANILMNDSTPPSFINCPIADLTISVDVDNCTSNPIFSTPIAEDNCSVTVTQTIGDDSGSSFDLGTTLVEFTAEDECGNLATCQFNIVVVDSDIPTILCPSSTIVVCADIGGCDWLADNIGPTLGVENCPGYTISYDISGATIGTGSNDASGETFEIGASTVCYTIIDASSNSSVCCFNVLVEDCELPTINCPSPMTVECNGSGNTTELNAWLSPITGNDNCDLVLDFDSYINNTIDRCGATNIVEYIFTATDDAGNMSSCAAIFTIEDTTEPSIDVPSAPLTVECDGATNSASLTAWLNDAGGAAASDICGSDITWTNNFLSGLTTDCGATGAVDVIFTATDDCGNTSTTTSIFTIDDTEHPVISCPIDITLECGDDLNTTIIENWINTASATDACSNPTITNDYPMSFVADCAITGVYTVTFTATDDCGNTSSCAPTITILDSTKPTIDIVAEDLILECADINNSAFITPWLIANGNAAASDNCSVGLTWSSTGLIPIAGCGNLLTTPYLFTVTDECGNTNTTIANVILEDTTPPGLILPFDQVEECGNIMVDLLTWQRRSNHIR